MGDWRTLDRFGRALRRHGAIGSTRIGLAYLRRGLHALTPRARRARRRERNFDAAWGVETSAVIPLESLAIEGNTWRYGTRSEAIDIETFEAVMAALPVFHDEFVFVDIGSGTGRALLLASHYPFREAIGVELAPQLHAISLENFRKYQAPGRRSLALHAVCGDAASFALPLRPLVVFLFNPFGPEVLRPVLDNLGRSIADAPRPVFVAYVNPVHAALVDEMPFLRRLVGGENYIIWTAHVPSTPAIRRTIVTAPTGPVVDCPDSSRGSASMMTD